jgi:hypothetical protein
MTRLTKANCNLTHVFDWSQLFKNIIGPKWFAIIIVPWQLSHKLYNFKITLNFLEINFFFKKKFLGEFF